MKKLIYWSTEENKGIYEDGTEVRAEEFEYSEEEITMDELIARLLEEARNMSKEKYWVEVCTIDPEFNHFNGYLSVEDKDGNCNTLEWC